MIRTQLWLGRRPGGLGPENIRQALGSWRVVSFDAAVEYALNCENGWQSWSRLAMGGFGPLTRREGEVAVMLGRVSPTGKSVKSS